MIIVIMVIILFFSSNTKRSGYRLLSTSAWSSHAYKLIPVYVIQYIDTSTRVTFYVSSAPFRKIELVPQIILFCETERNNAHF